MGKNEIVFKIGFHWPVKGLCEVFVSTNRGLNAREVPSGSTFPWFILTHLHRAQGFKGTKTLLFLWKLPHERSGRGERTHGGPAGERD